MEENKDLLPEFLEFKKEALSMTERQAKGFSDEMVIRKAKIYKVLGPKDDRLQLQVLPELQGIDDEEMDDLPKYPPLIKGTVITGKSHKEDGDKAEYVWVLCTPDLQVGYVIGKANIFGDPTKKYQDSYSWKDVKSFLRERRALPDDFDYKHIMIRNWVASDEGGLIEFYNYITGDWGVINTSGSILTIQQKRIYMRVGTPSSGGGRVAFSAITMTADKIHCKSPNFEIDSDDVVIAHNGLNVVAAATSGPIIGKNGAQCQPVMNVHI